MRARSLVLWCLLGPLACLSWDLADPSAFAAAVTGAACLAGVVVLIYSDGLRRRRLAEHPAEQHGPGRILSGCPPAGYEGCP